MYKGSGSKSVRHRYAHHNTGIHTTRLRRFFVNYSKVLLNILLNYILQSKNSKPQNKAQVEHFYNDSVFWIQDHNLLNTWEHLNNKLAQIAY